MWAAAERRDATSLPASLTPRSLFFNVERWPTPVVAGHGQKRHVNGARKLEHIWGRLTRPCLSSYVAMSASWLGTDASG